MNLSALAPHACPAEKQESYRIPFSTIPKPNG